MSADEGRMEDIRDYIVKQGLDDWNFYLGIKEDKSRKAAWLLPEAVVISLLLGGDPEVTETLIDDRTEVIYPALAPLPVGPRSGWRRTPSAVSYGSTLSP